MNNINEHDDFSGKNEHDDFSGKLDDLFLNPDGYECIWCGHVQTIDGICEYCGSYALEPLNSEPDDII